MAASRAFVGYGAFKKYICSIIAIKMQELNIYSFWMEGPEFQ